MPDIIKPKRATKSVADKSDKVLEKDELLLISPNTGSGTGRYGVKIGDGATATKDLPYAIDGEKADEMIVSEFTKESNENPVLSPGDKIKTLCGKLLKKFTYIETLLGKKVNTSDIYDGTDSSSTTKVATANSVRQVNEKADNNTNQLNQLNSNISGISKDLNDVKKTVDPIKSTVVDNADTNILNSVNLVVWGPESYSTPYKTGNTIYGNGFCITYSTGDQWLCQLAMAVGDSNLFTRHRRLGVWSGWTTIGTASKQG